MSKRHAPNIGLGGRSSLPSPITKRAEEATRARDERSTSKFEQKVLKALDVLTEAVVKLEEKVDRLGEIQQPKEKRTRQVRDNTERSVVVSVR